MSEVWGREEMVRRTLVEGVGTFLLVLIGPGAMMVNQATNGVITHLALPWLSELSCRSWCIRSVRSPVRTSIRP